jgi:hypothetical protein
MVDRLSHSRSIARAIRRSRAYRERIQRRRRRSLIAATAVSIAVTVGMTASLVSFAGTDVADAAIDRAKDLVELLDQRSPGARSAAELTKTKHPSEAVTGSERIVPTNLAEVLAPPPPAPALAEVDIHAPPLVLELPSALPPEMVLLPAVIPPGGGPIPPPGGGGPPSSPPPPPPPSPPPPPALPEPGTWMTMILGFGLVGALLRRDRAARRPRLSA